MRLHDLTLSGNCYKVRLFAALIGQPLTLKPVDFLGGEQRQPAFLALNPFGQMPVLEDEGRVLRDSQAILVYLARKHGDPAWLPEDAGGLAEVMQWLSTAANEVQHGPADARLALKFGLPIDLAAAQATAAHVLGLLDAHLQRHDWLACGRPTVADCAVYPYCALAGEGGIDLAPYPALRAWFDRLRALPGYVSMPGL
ncbi:glutathione S-transferase family protein [Aquariibacter albus]|uniref:Glutathione S-transferase n=1 Tax=Aquariibacter albus TaxID=2759899 RepID=A0A839HT91_9BURK|nr:glutathione S-transferase [Aquariibacter albus]MBB1162441.1 glutathione S-transferase [Aquariibacter albus]